MLSPLIKYPGVYEVTQPVICIFCSMMSESVKLPEKEIKLKGAKTEKYSFLSLISWYEGRELQYLKQVILFGFIQGNTLCNILVNAVN